MILAFITIVMITGSVAAGETTSNDTTTLQTTTNNMEKAANTESENTQKAVNTTTATKTITKNTNRTSADNTLKTSTKTVKSTSKPVSTKTTVYNVTSTKGSKITLKALVTTTKNVKVKNGTVVFKINGKTIGKSAVKNGISKYTYKVPSTWTNLNYTITAVYAKNSKYARSTATSTLKLKSNLKTTVKVTDITTTQGNTVTLKAVIKTKDGKYAKTGKVAFKINEKTVGTAKVSNGGAKLTYTIPKNWSSKTYNITVVYGKNDYYQKSTGYGKLKVQSKTVPNISISTTSVVSGKSTTFVATVTDKSGKKVNGGKLTFKVNGKTIGKTTVSKGVAKIKYSVPSSWKGKYTISVVYGGYGTYTSKTKTTSLQVTKGVSTKITINTTKAVSGQSKVLTATITDSSGKLVTGGKAVFKLNGKTIGTVNVKSGTAKLTYKISSSWNGKYSITVVYGGYGKYLSKSKTATLTVTKKSSPTSFKVPSGYEKYVKATKNCQVDNKKIVSLVSSLTSGVKSAYTASVKMYNYVRDKVSYSSYYNTRYGAVNTLSRKYGNCVDQSHLLVAMLRTANIPARYCHATCSFRSGLVTGHVWAEAYVNGKWYSCDTTSRSNSFNHIVNWKKSTKVYRYTSLSF